MEIDSHLNNTHTYVHTHPPTCKVLYVLYTYILRYKRVNDSFHQDTKVWRLDQPGHRLKMARDTVWLVNQEVKVAGPVQFLPSHVNFWS